MGGKKSIIFIETGKLPKNVYFLTLLQGERDQFFVARPRLKNKTYENLLQDRNQEEVDADFFNETRLSNFLCPR